MGHPRSHFDAASAAVLDQVVTSVDMKVGAYALANAGAMPTEGARKITVTHTSTDTTDTLGTISVVGKSLAGQTITEDITPLADDTATGDLWFASVTSVTGADWEVDTSEGTKDKIEVGCTSDTIAAQGSGTFYGLIISTAAVSSITVADAAGTIALIDGSTAGYIGPFDADFAGYLKVTQTGAADITVLHSASLPTTYAMS